MILEARAGGVSLRLDADALHVGERRIPRARVKGIEVGRGTMVFTGDAGVLARVDFTPSERAALEKIERELAPRKKSIDLFLDQPSYRPGELVRGHVELRWPRTSPIRGVRVGLIGAESTTITTSNGKHASTRREYRPLIAEEYDLFGVPPVGLMRATSEALRRLLGRQDYPELPAGQHKYDFAFQLPANALPSYTGTHAEVGYQIYARVDIPLGFDLKFDGVLSVGPPEGSKISKLKGRVDRTGGWFKAEVDMKIDIDPCPLEPGQRLRGRIRVRNHSSKKIRGATIRLLAMEEARAGSRERELFHELNQGYLTAPDPSSPEQDVTFEIPIHGPFPYRGRHSRMDYVLEAKLDTAMGRATTVHVPLETE